jgi:hypothetical protein
VQKIEIEVGDPHEQSKSPSGMPYSILGDEAWENRVHGANRLWKNVWGKWWFTQFKRKKG